MIGNPYSLKSIFDAQINFQEKVLGIGDEDPLPFDNVEWFQYHIAGITEELGELLKADKRWKTHRNTRYVKEEKLDELADVFIEVVNLSIFSGFDSDVLFKAVIKKIQENTIKLEDKK